jgi:hypothetical protein
MIIIDDHNDSGQYYKTMITIVSYAPNFTLALVVLSITIVSDATITDVDRSVIYDRNVFIIQATRH